MIYEIWCKQCEKWLTPRRSEGKAKAQLSHHLQMTHKMSMVSSIKQALSAPTRQNKQ